MGLDIGVDPGVNNGVAVWNAGHLVLTDTIRMLAKTKPATKKLPKVVRTDEERLTRLYSDFTCFLSGVVRDFGSFRIARVESFGSHNSRYGAGDMILCAQARAAVVLALHHFGIPDVGGLSKGKRPKEEADWLATQYGIPMTKAKEHERDAIHLSVIAGFDKK